VKREHGGGSRDTHPLSHLRFIPAAPPQIIRLGQTWPPLVLISDLASSLRGCCHKSDIPADPFPYFFLSPFRVRASRSVQPSGVAVVDKAPRITRQKWPGAILWPHNRLENAKFFPRDTRIMPSIELGISTPRAVPARFRCLKERKSAMRDSACRASR
jgi:hypothetical protein